METRSLPPSNQNNPKYTYPSDPNLEWLLVLSWYIHPWGVARIYYNSRFHPSSRMCSSPPKRVEPWFFIRLHPICWLSSEEHKVVASKWFPEETCFAKSSSNLENVKKNAVFKKRGRAGDVCLNKGGDGTVGRLIIHQNKAQRGFYFPFGYVSRFWDNESYCSEVKPISPLSFAITWKILLHVFDVQMPVNLAI